MTEKENIKRLLNMDELQYGNMLMEKAYDYLNHIMRLDKWGMKILTSCPMFWKWWVNQWERRDKIWHHEKFLSERLYLTEEKRMRYKELYNELHSVEHMNIVPNKLVMEQSYAVMVGEVLDNKNKK